MFIFQQQSIILYFLFILFLSNQLYIYLASYNMLEQERKKVTFNVSELSNIIYGSNQQYNRFMKAQKIVSSDPILAFNPEHLQISRKQQIQLTAKKLVRYHELFEYDRTLKLYELVLFSKQLPLGVHFSMFNITLNNLCNDKQRQMFLQRSYKGQIYGCYAQTELGHGSDVQGVQTTATYDKNTETFIMNSPTSSAIKWWIGELGIFANHAAVMAQLIINNKRYGVHVFIVNIRDMKTHLPLEGIEVGDIGPKYGFSTKDNGFLKFSNVRIPRQNMLMKFSQVSKEGQFSRSGNQKVTFATMLTIRANIPTTAYYVLSKAVTIATRYSLIRQQFKSEQGKQMQILDYQLQQQKILPHIAQTFAVLFGSRKIKQISISVIAEVRSKNEFSRLNPTHALSSGLKAVFTSDALKAIEILRRSAGGHGFSQYSGLPSLLKQFAPNATFEGENTILFLQTARFLLKALQQIKKGKKVVEFVSYLKNVSELPTLLVPIEGLQQLKNPEILKNIFANHSYFKIIQANQKMMSGLSSGLTPKYVWDHYAGISLSEAGAAFTYYWIFQNFMEYVNMVTDKSVKIVLTKILCLYGTQKILDNSKGYYEGEIIKGSGFKLLFAAKQKFLSELRNEALGIVEAFGYDDNTLNSAIGRRDGRAYQTLLQWAKNHNRVNRPEIQKQLYDILSESKGKIKLKAKL